MFRSKQFIYTLVIASGMLISGMGMIINYSANPPIPSFVIDGGRFTTPEEDAEISQKQNARIARSKYGIYLLIFGVIVGLLGTALQAALQAQKESRDKKMSGKEETDRKNLYIRGLLIGSLSLPIFILIFKDPRAWISPYLLFLTLVAIFWYSLETRGLKKQMVMQNELSIRPRLIFIETVSGAKQVKNIGHGAALDIRIQDHVHRTEGLGAIIYRFECQKILEPGEERELNIKTIKGDETEDVNAFDRAQLLHHTFEVRLSYKDVLGQEYDKDTSKLGEDMLKWKSFPR